MTKNKVAHFYLGHGVEIQKSSPRMRALNESWVGKIRNFQPISRRVSETVQDRTKVTIND